MKKNSSMMFLVFVTSFCLLSFNIVHSQDVGIGTPTPDYRLHISATDSSILKLENLTSLNINVRSDLLFKTGNRYSGAIKTIGTSGVDARLGLFTFASIASSGLKERLSILDNGMVGIDNTSPFAPLSFANFSGNKIDLFYNSTVSRYGIGIQTGLLQFYTNGVASDFAFGYGSSSTFTEVMRIKGNGNVGIGNTNPIDAGLVVDKKVGSVNAMFGRSTTGVAIESNYPGVGLNCYYNGGRKTITTGYAGLLTFDPVNGNLGLYNSNVSTATDAATTVSPRIFIDKDGEIGVEGNTAPHVPLAFANLVGSKISLFGSVETSHYGFGIQSSLLQMYTATSGTDIAFGYGGSSAFTERMRIKGNGNVGIGNSDPAFILDVSGRMRLRHAGISPGIWFNKPDNTQGSFIGQYDATNFGIWGPGSAGTWKFLFDGSDGTLRIGTFEKATGYLVNIGGRLIAEEVRVQLEASWPDYVFNSDYALMPLAELDNYIQANNHLPGFAKAEVYENEGADLGETQRKLLEKVEELTLYVIELKKEIEQLKNK